LWPLEISGTLLLHCKRLKVAFFDHSLKTLLQFEILAMAPRAPIISTGSEIGGGSTNWELDIMFSMEFSFSSMTMCGRMMMPEGGEVELMWHNIPDHDPQAIKKLVPSTILPSTQSTGFNSPQKIYPRPLTPSGGSTANGIQRTSCGSRWSAS
jgi:hypothetical protein